MSFEPDTILSDLQDAVRDRIAEDSWFGLIDVHTPSDMTESGSSKTPAVLEQRIEQSLSALKKGACIVVAVPVLSGFSPDAPGVFCDSAVLVCRVIENPLVCRARNGLNKTADQIGMRLTRLLWQFTYRDSAFTPQRSGLVPNQDDSNLVWDLVLKTHLELPPLVIPAT
jgi:hypothetical protein